MKQIHSLLIIILIAFSACAQQTESEVKAEEPVAINYTTELVVSDLNIPWGMTFYPMEVC